MVRGPELTGQPTARHRAPVHGPAAHRGRRGLARLLVLALLVVPTVGSLAGVLVGLGPASARSRPAAAPNQPTPAGPLTPHAAQTGHATQTVGSARTATPTTSPQNVVGLGDSVPAGAACGCTDFVRLLAQRLGGGAAATNLAVPGQTSQGLLEQLRDPQVRAAVAGADVVVVTIGANDVEAQDPQDCETESADCYADAVEALGPRLDGIAAQVAGLLTRPGARLLLTGYWSVFLDGDTARARGPVYVHLADAVTREVNDRVRSAAAAASATYVDLEVPFHGTDGSHDPTPLLADDGDHPDAAGHALIAATLGAALRAS